MVSEQLPGGEVLSRTTDAFGRPAGISVAGIGDPGSPDYAVTCGYDTAGRFGSVTTLAPLAALAVQYDYVQGSDLLAGWSSNVGMSFNRTFEPNRDLISSVTNAWDATPISSFAYTNDEIGRRTARVDSGLTQNSFGYNMRSELVNAIMGTNTYGYEFDPIGNRIASTNNTASLSYTANELNQYLEIANGQTIEPSYDDDGNMTTYGDWTLAWNGENRLTQISNFQFQISYTYDYQGRMVEKTTNGDTTRHIWDDFNIIAELGASQTRYNIWGLDLSQTPQGAGGVGGLLAVAVAGGADPGMFHPAYDANGNITEYVNATGNVIASRTYSPFGETTATTGNADAFTHWWSTKPWDPVTGFSEYEFRMYHTGLGRWVNRDPIGEEGGVNVFAHTRNSPIASIDYLGMQAKESLCKCARISLRVYNKTRERTGIVREWVYSRWYQLNQLDVPTIGVSKHGSTFQVVVQPDLANAECHDCCKEKSTSGGMRYITCVPEVTLSVDGARYTGNTAGLWVYSTQNMIFDKPRLDFNIFVPSEAYRTREIMRAGASISVLVWMRYGPYGTGLTEICLNRLYVTTLLQTDANGNWK